MVKYLQMDGVDDRLQVPSMDVNEFVLTFKPRPQAWRQYINFGGKQINRTGSNTDSFHTDYQTVYVDGIQATTNTAFIKLDTKQVLRGVLKQGVNISSYGTWILFNGGTGYTEGDLYEVKFYNGSTLVAHYDMSTGTVQDQSGNGNHATLTGGTWVDDGTGEEPPPSGETIDAGDITLSASSALIAQANRVLTADSDLQANSNLTALANHILNADSLLSASTSLTAEGEVISLELSVNMSASSSLTAQATRIRQSNADLSAITNLTAEGEVLSLELFVNMSASSSLQASGSRIVQGNAVLSAHGEVIAEGTAIYNGESLFLATSDLTVHTGEELIGTIQLEGKRVLNVYLVAKRDLVVNLKGGLYVTAKNQNFSMVQGDTKYIQFPVDGVDNLAGCTVKWGVKKKESSTEYELFKDDFTIVDGKIQIKVESIDTLNLLGTYYHETELTDQSGNVSTVMKGMLQINKGIVQ